MLKIHNALTKLAAVMIDLVQQQARVGTALNDVAREQRITNLIVRSQITTDPTEKQRLIDQAAQRMDTPRRRSPHDPL
jgi:hypothetical protein